jgi:NAD(P)-dependent dehydrogenase (short-subunit alcohol dehydrogenase family)
MKNIVVIGGNSGIGLAFVEMMANQNKISVLNRSGMKEAIPNVKHYTYDALSDDFPVKDKIDGLVYFPGSINLKPLKNLKDDDFLKDLQINLLGAVRTIRNALSLLQTNGLSSIVLFSTVAVQQGMAYHTSVAAAKGAVEGFAKSLAAELAPKVRVNVVAPSITDTPMAGRILGNDQAREKAAQRHPLNAYGQPEDIAAAVKYLIEDDSKWVTGQVLHVDGGMSAIKPI